MNPGLKSFSCRVLPYFAPYRNDIRIPTPQIEVVWSQLQGARATSGPSIPIPGETFLSWVCDSVAKPASALQCGAQRRDPCGEPKSCSSRLSDGILHAANHHEESTAQRSVGPLTETAHASYPYRASSCSELSRSRPRGLCRPRSRQVASWILQHASETRRQGIMLQSQRLPSDFWPDARWSL